MHAASHRRRAFWPVPTGRESHNSMRFAGSSMIWPMKTEATLLRPALRQSASPCVTAASAAHGADPIVDRARALFAGRPCGLDAFAMLVDGVRGDIGAVRIADYAALDAYTHAVCRPRVWHHDRRSFRRRKNVFTAPQADRRQGHCSLTNICGIWPRTPAPGRPISGGCALSLAAGKTLQIPRHAFAPISAPRSATPLHLRRNILCLGARRARGLPLPASALQ